MEKPFERKTYNKEIQETADSLAREAMELFKDIQSIYWAMSEKIAANEYSNHWPQMEDIRRLSLLGIAAHKMWEAYSAINAARCN